MTDDGPRELAIDLRWFRGRLGILVIHGDRPLHSDTLDPRSATARTRAINKLKAKLPAIDTEELERRLVEAAAMGPPPDPNASSGPRAMPAAFENPEPSAEPVRGAELLDEIANVLSRFVVMPVHGAEVAALWILHTFVYDIFEFTPRLLITSPSMRCGKSRLFRVLAALVSRPLACEGITGPALFRSLEKYRPTVLIDEGDTMLGGRETSEVLRGVINAGHQRGGRVIRCVGDEAEPKTFDVFAPIAIAMIGKPPATIVDRSIQLEMRRRTASEKVDRFEAGRSLREALAPLAQKCVRWSQDQRSHLLSSRPVVPAGIDDRAADCWYGLLAIADAAGGRWPSLARAIAVAVMSGRDNSEGLGVELLHDLKALFDSRDVDRLSTSNIVAALVGLEERPWLEFRRGQPITPRQLATLLAAFGIRSRNMRMPDGTVPKGYLRRDFEDAWNRYFPEHEGDPGSGSATPLRSLSDNDLGASRFATAADGVAGTNDPNPLQDKGRSGVADEAGEVSSENPGQVPAQPIDQLRALVEAMAADIEALPAGTAPFSSEALRTYYRNAVQLHGVAAALADAIARYQHQVEGTFEPLPDQRRTESPGGPVDQLEGQGGNDA